MSDFNVFDEWGNYVGKFTPAGSGFGDTILMLIAMLILWTIGFSIYLFFKLIIEGFKAAARMEWGKAALYWAIPGLITAVFVAMMASGMATAVAQERRQVREAQEAREFVDLARRGQLVHVERIRSASTEESGCSGTQCSFVFGKYEFTNTTGDLVLLIEASWASCREFDKSSREPGTRLGPGESISAFCAEGNFPSHWSPPDVLVSLYGRGLFGGPSADIGLDGKVYKIRED